MKGQYVDAYDLKFILEFYVNLNKIKPKKKFKDKIGFKNFDPYFCFLEDVTRLKCNMMKKDYYWIAESLGELRIDKKDPKIYYYLKEELEKCLWELFKEYAHLKNQNISQSQNIPKN